MAFEDKTLVCKECGKEFTFTAGEQEFYAEKGFENEPARCRDCRDKRRAQTAARRPRCPSSRRMTVRFIAVTASTSIALRRKGIFA